MGQPYNGLRQICSNKVNSTFGGEALRKTHGVFITVPMNPPIVPDIKLFVNWACWVYASFFKDVTSREMRYGTHLSFR